MTLESRGILAGMAVADLRAKLRQAPYDRLHERLRERTHEVMAAARANGYGTLSYGALAWHSITPMCLEAALLWRLGDDSAGLAYLGECLAVLDRCARDPAEQKRLSHGKPPINSYAEMALALAVAEPGLSPAQRAQALALMRDCCINEHDGALRYTGQGGGNNIALCRVLNAGVCALVWGEASGHPEWRAVLEHAINHTRAYLKVGFDASGFGYEGTGYSYSVYHYLFLLVQLLRQQGVADLYASEPRLRQICEATFHLAFPDASGLVNLNDHGLLLPLSMGWLLPCATIFQEPAYRGLWYAYEGPEHPRRPYGDSMPWFRREIMPGPVAIDEQMGMVRALLYWDASAPATPLPTLARPTAVYAAGTETLCWRSSWQPDAVALTFVGAGRSHACYTHRHADAGHFTLFAHGDYLAVDTGRYNVDEDQHSVMLVNGQCHAANAGWGMSHLGGRLLNVQQTPLLSYARAEAAQMKDCYWADRHFLAVPLGGDECYFICVDNLNHRNAQQRYLWQLQCHHEAKITIQEPNRATVAGPQAALDLTFVWPGAADFPQAPHAFALRQDVQEWAWPYGKGASRTHEHTGLMISSDHRPRLLGELHGWNGQLLTVIAPRRRADAPRVVQVREHRRLLWVEVAGPGFTDTIIAALDHRFIQLPGISAQSELLVQRRDAAGELVSEWQSG